MLALIFAAGCGPSSFEDFRSQYVSRLCANARHCGLIGEADPCPLPASLPSAGVLDVPSAIDDGKLKYNSLKAQDCLDSVGGAPCNDAAAALRIYEHCHAVIGPNLATGGKCDDDVECVGGTCDGEGGCPGRCIAFPTPGASCLPGECDPTVQYCSSDGGESGTCLPHKGEGKACAADDECDYPFFCTGGKCLRFPRVGDGKSCAAPDAVCNDGSYCAPGGLCAPLHARGAACDLRASCRRSNGCASTVPDAGLCQPWSDEGLPCADGLCPASQLCAMNSDGGDADAGLPGSCRADSTLPAGPGESCRTRACVAGLYCDGDKSCEYLRLLYGSCEPSDSGCLPGLTCDPDTRRCVTGIVCLAPDAGSRD